MADEHSLPTRKEKKRKTEQSQKNEDKKVVEDGSFEKIQSSLHEICTCFGVGGFFKGKKRKIESQKGFLIPLKEEWDVKDFLQDLPTGIQQRYIKELSTVSFKLLGIMKRVIMVFKQLHEERKYLKDIAMDVDVKDIRTKPSLPLPERYVEIGLWKQVMQLNQQVCRKMEKLEETEENLVEGIESFRKTEDEVDVKKRKEKEVADKRKSFHDYYMDMVTATFGDDLDRLRQEESLDSRKVELLISCLESGRDIWTDLEKDLLQSLGT